MDKSLTIMSIREYARSKGVDESSVRKMRKNGKLSEKCFGVNPKNKRPFIYKELADVDWANTFNPNYKRDIKGTGQEEKPLTNFDTVSPADGKAGPLDELTRTKKLREDIALQNDLLKLNELKGKLVSKEKVYNILYGFGAEIRAALQDLPDQLLDNIRAAGTRDEAYAVFSTGIDEALSKLANIDKAVQL